MQAILFSIYSYFSRAFPTDSSETSRRSRSKLKNLNKKDRDHCTHQQQKKSFSGGNTRWLDFHSRKRISFIQPRKFGAPLHYDGSKNDSRWHGPINHHCVFGTKSLCHLQSSLKHFLLASPGTDQLSISSLDARTLHVQACTYMYLYHCTSALCLPDMSTLTRQS